MLDASFAVFKMFSCDQFTGAPILSLGGMGLNEGGGLRADGAGTTLELDWGLVCEQGWSHLGCWCG